MTPMAINAQRQAAVLRSAQSIIAQARARAIAAGRGGKLIPPSNLYDRLKKIWGDEPGYSYQQTRALAQRALDMYASAQSINRRTVNALPLDQLKADPSLQGRPERVRYDVLVTGHRPDGTTSTFRTEILSSDVMTRAQMEEYVRGHLTELDAFLPQGSPGIVGDGTQPAPTVTVLAAGRRP